MLSKTPAGSHYKGEATTAVVEFQALDAFHVLQVLVSA